MGPQLIMSVLFRGLRSMTIPNPVGRTFCTTVIKTIRKPYVEVPLKTIGFS